MTRSLLRRCAALATALLLTAGMAVATPLAAHADPIQCMSTECGGGGGGGPVTPPASTDATLSSLSLSAGTLSPTFSPGTTSYTATVPHATSLLAVTSATSFPGAPTTVNGVSTPSGTPSGAIALAIGANTITVVVTAQNGATNMYTITVTRAAAPLSSNADLSGLALRGGSLSPAFAAGTTAYTVSVPYSTNEVDVTPVVADATGATATVNGVAAGKGTPVALAVGPNPITIVVTAQDGTVKTYVINATRAAPSNDARLKSFAFSVPPAGAASWTSGTTLTFPVAYASSSVSIGVLPVDANATVTVNGAVEPQGGVSAPITIAAGSSNTFTVTIVAQDGVTSATYVVTVTRAASNNADLADLNLSVGTLSPAFTPATTSYTASVGHSTKQITISALKADATATTTIDGLAVASTVRPLAVGDNTFTIVNTAQDGTVKTTTVTITRAAASTNAELREVSLTEGTLSPAFAPSTTSYRAAVDYLTTETTLEAIAADATASVTLNGAAVTSAVVPLAVGENIVTIVTTAEDGTTTKTTTVTITRAAPDLTLNALSVSEGTLSPAFDPDTTAYTLALPYPVTSVDVATAATVSGWAVSINGDATADATITAPVGTRIVIVTVTAPHGETRDYTVTITRAAASTDADLSGLTLSEGTLSPAFDAATTSYTATVGYLTRELTVAATAADATSATTINGRAVTSAAVALSVGPNVVTIVTTAEDGTTTKTTTVVVTREDVPVPTVALDLDVAPGDAAAGAPSTVSASNLLPGSTATLTMHSTPVVLATGTVLADGSVVLNATLPAGIEAGAHRLVFDAVAQDGTLVTRTAWFTVLLAGTVGAVSLTGPVAYVEPAIAAPTAASPARALPVTGADAAAPALLAGVLLALGGLVLAFRRRWVASR